MRIEIVHDSVVFQDCDAIVNAAAYMTNIALSGVCGRIWRKTQFHTIYLLKYCKIRDGFFVLSKLSEGRRSIATLTEMRQSHSEKGP